MKIKKYFGNSDFPKPGESTPNALLAFGGYGFLTTLDLSPKLPN